MEYQPIERLVHLLERLRAEPWQDRLNNARCRDELNYWLRHLERWVDDDLRYPAPWDSDRLTPARLQLHRMEDKLDALLRKPGGCNAPSDFADRLPNFITTLTAINDGNLAVGRKKFRAYLQGWLADTQRCVIADPFIFKSGSESSSEYANGLVEIVGSSAKRVDFYFRPDVKAYDAGVATGIFSALQKSYVGPPGTSRTMVFHACEELHDRVWLRHTSITDDPPHSGWEARVVGASVNGVRARPTYVVDMTEDDANDYSKYLKNVRDALLPGSVTLAPPP